MPEAKPALVSALQDLNLVSQIQHTKLLGVLLSSDEKRVLTWSENGSVRLWNTKTAQPIGQDMKHETKVTGAVFSPDQTQILSWSIDGTAKLWDA